MIRPQYSPKCEYCDFYMYNQPANIQKILDADPRFSPLPTVLRLNPSGSTLCTKEACLERTINNHTR